MNAGIRVPLSMWIAANPIHHDLMWRPSAIAQFEILQQLPEVFPIGPNRPDVFVVGTHTSKSIELPVVEVLVPRILRMHARDNFHDWAVSVLTARPLTDLDTTDFDFDELRQHYFQGFEEAGLWVFGPYNEGAQAFSFHFRKSSEEFLKALERIFERARLSPTR